MFMKPNQPNHRSTFKILVVEDNLLDFELMESAFCAQLPCELNLAMTKAQFENELAKDQPDVIVSDSNVIEFDGFTALKIARGKCPDVPFVFLFRGRDRPPAQGTTPARTWVGFPRMVVLPDWSPSSKKSSRSGANE